jgi:hypothetical protein
MFYGYAVDFDPVVTHNKCNVISFYAITNIIRGMPNSKLIF